MKKVSNRRHITTAMIIASSNILRKGIHIVVNRNNSFNPVYTQAK